MTATGGSRTPRPIIWGSVIYEGGFSKGPDLPVPKKHSKISLASGPARQAGLLRALAELDLESDLPSRVGVPQTSHLHAPGLAAGEYYTNCLFKIFDDKF